MMSRTTSLKGDENQILDMKQNLIQKPDTCIEDASKQESEEILSEIETLSDEDLKITTIKHFTS